MKKQQRIAPFLKPVDTEVLSGLEHPEQSFYGHLGTRLCRLLFPFLLGNHLG